MEVADALEEYDIMFLEEPLHRWDDGNLIRKQACDIIQPDVTNYGSLQEVQHAGASVRLCAGLRKFELLEHMSRDVEWGDESVKYGFTVEDDIIQIPDNSGLGVAFHPDAAREHLGEPKDSHSLFNEQDALKRS